MKKTMNDIFFIFQVRSPHCKSAYAKIEGEVSGNISFSQCNEFYTRISGFIEGLEPGNHGLHIHEHGDTSDKCANVGGHYNPEHVSALLSLENEHSWAKQLSWEVGNGNLHWQNQNKKLG